MIENTGSSRLQPQLQSRHELLPKWCHAGFVFNHVLSRKPDTQLYHTSVLLSAPGSSHGFHSWFAVFPRRSLTKERLLAIQKGTSTSSFWSFYVIFLTLEAFSLYHTTLHQERSVAWPREARTGLTGLTCSLLVLLAGLSPSGKLPVLEVDGAILTQSKVILGYVAKELSK